MEFKYNPGFSSDADLIESFVVRKPYLELILENLRENTGSANQHVLVVGARGTGKTMLVRRVVAEVRTDSQLNALWYPLVLLATKRSGKYLLKQSDADRVRNNAILVFTGRSSDGSLVYLDCLG